MQQEVLRSLVDELAQAAQQVISRDEFGGLFKRASEALDLNPMTTADELRVSVATVGRWKDSISSPYRTARPKVLNWLKAKVEAKLSEPAPSAQ